MLKRCFMDQCFFRWPYFIIILFLPSSCTIITNILTVLDARRFCRLVLALDTLFKRLLISFISAEILTNNGVIIPLIWF